MRQDDTPPGGWQPEQRLSVDEAITAFPLGADFIAVDTDPYHCEAADLPRTKVITSVVGGDIRWRA